MNEGISEQDSESIWWFADELPWLNQSHRALVGIASGIRAKLMSGEDISVNGLNLLRLCLGQMGATPPMIAAPMKGTISSSEKSVKAKKSNKVVKKRTHKKRLAKKL
jgi:hypothetical protein